MADETKSKTHNRESDVALFTEYMEFTDSSPDYIPVEYSVQAKAAAARLVPGMDLSIIDKFIETPEFYQRAYVPFRLLPRYWYRRVCYLFSLKDDWPLILWMTILIALGIGMLAVFLQTPFQPAHQYGVYQPLML